MKDTYKPFLFIFTAIILVIVLKNVSLVMQTVKVYGKHLNIPHSLVVPNCENELLPNVQDTCNKYKLFFYIAEDKCSLCSIANAVALTNMCRRYNTTDVIPMMVVTPSSNNDEYQMLFNFIRDSDYEIPIYLDKNNDLKSLNLKILESQTINFFLLDRNNYILILGNPLGGKKLMELYDKQLVTYVK